MKGKNSNFISKFIGELRAKIRDLTPNDYFILLFSCAIFIFFYWVDLGRPGAIFPLGWYETWGDQGAYYNMVLGIAHGNLGSFQYPIGYPFFGYLGSLLYPNDPFLMVNFFGFMIFSWLSYLIFKKFFNDSLSLISGILLAMVAVLSFETPWSSTISAVCMIYIIYIAIYERYNYINSILAGICIGLAFAARIGDVIPVLFAYGFYVGYPIIKNKKVQLSHLISLPIAAIIIGFTMFINYIFSNQILGNYGTSVMQAQYFNIISIPYNLFGFLFNPYTFGGETYPLSISVLKFSFLFVLVPLGLYLILRNKDSRREGILFTIILIGWGIIYLSHVGISAMSLKYMTGYHYIKMLFPILILLSVKVVDDLSQVKTKAIKPDEIIKITFAYFILLAGVLFVFSTFFNFTPINLNQKDVKINPNVSPEGINYVYDDDINTGWSTEGNLKAGMNISIELDKVYLINRIGINSAPHSSEYTKNSGIAIYYSLDNKNWIYQDLWEYTGYDPYVANIYFRPINAKYILLNITKDSEYPWMINELEIYGR